MRTSLRGTVKVRSGGNLVTITRTGSVVKGLSLATISSNCGTIVFCLPRGVGRRATGELLGVIRRPPRGALFVFVARDPRGILRAVFSHYRDVEIVPLDERRTTQIGTLAPTNSQRRCGRFVSLFSSLVGTVISESLVKTLRYNRAVTTLRSHRGRGTFYVFTNSYVEGVFVVRRGIPRVTNITSRRVRFCSNVTSQVNGKFYAESVTGVRGIITVVSEGIGSGVLFYSLIGQVFLDV